MYVYVTMKNIQALKPCYIKQKNLNVRQNIVLNTMKFIYKILKEMLPKYLLANCTFVKDVGT